ncbi:MAG: peptide chain release factor 1 [Christensenellales bacterium]|jgi:peptide chain release factor 1
MIEKLHALKERFEELSAQIADIAVIADQDEWRKKVKERAALEPVMEAFDRYLACEQAIAEAKELLSDPEMKEMAQEELSEKKELLAQLEQELKMLLLPKDPDDDKNVILEIRAGTGGEEAALFGADLMRMYLRYAERHRLKAEIMNINETELGGVKEADISLSGTDVYAKLKYESGVHRVQRVPETEAQGRIQTSAATVVVLPEVEDVNVDINPSDLKIDTFRASGAGGQHVNKTESAIRITHLPTGIVVQCMDERSQLKNKEKAMRALKTRLYDFYRSQQDEKLTAARRSMVGTGDRSERIRTYNFPQSRVTDHRIGLTLYKLDAFLDGDLDEMIEALSVAARTAQLEAME